MFRKSKGPVRRAFSTHKIISHETRASPKLQPGKNHLAIKPKVNGIEKTTHKTLAIPIKGLTRFQISSEELIYFKDGKLKSYNLKTLAEGEINLPTTDILDARTEKEKLYLLNSKSLNIYHVKS